MIDRVIARVSYGADLKRYEMENTPDLLEFTQKIRSVLDNKQSK